MRQSLADLLSVVYRHYPPGLDSDAPGYKDTEEHRRLRQARVKAGAKGNPWRVLLERLSARLPAANIQDGSWHLPSGDFDGGYSGCYWLQPRGPHEKNHIIGFLISFLVPCYVVYSSTHVAIPGGGPRDWSQEIRFTFTPDEAPSAEVITEELLAVFPGYEPMPPEIGNLIVPDVVAGTKSMGATTLYHCLFTDAW